MKFSSDLLHIFCIDSLYHTHQYVHDFKLIYFLHFWVFFHCLYLEKCGLRKMLRFLIKSYFLWSFHQIHFKFAAWFHFIILIKVWLLTSLYMLLFFCIFSSSVYKNRRGIVTTCSSSSSSWGKLLRQKIMSSFISSLAQNLFIFAVLIHKVVLINNQALINIHMYYFSHFSMFLAMFQLRKYLCGKIVKAKDHVQFYIKFNSESFQICYTTSLYHIHQYVGAFKLIYFVIFFIFCVLSLLLLRKMWPVKNVKV